MAKEDKYWNNPVDLNVDWGGDPVKTEGKPLSGRAVQDTIKNALNSKVGYIGYCAANKTNVLTKDEASFLEFERLINEGKIDDAEAYKIGEFKAMATDVITITPTDYPSSVMEGSKGVTISFEISTKNTNENYVYIEDYNYKITNSNNPNEYINDTVRADKNGKVTVNIDKILAVGTNSIMINVTGQDSDVSSFKTILIKVIRLSISDTFKISNVYDFRTTQTNVISVPYTVTTNAPTKIYWFIDYSDKIGDKKIEPSVYTSSSPGQIDIEINDGDLTNGVHSLMYYAEYEDATSAEPFRTPITYKEFFVVSHNNFEMPLFSFAFEIPFSNDFIENKRKPYFTAVKQYDTITLPFAIFTTKKEENVKVMVKDSKDTNFNAYASLNISTGTIVNQKITIKNEGLAEIKLVSGNVESDTFGVTIEKNEDIKPPFSNNLILSLSAEGKDNKSDGFDSWVSSISGKTYSTTFKGFQWTKNSGWRDDKLIIRNGSEVEINFQPFSEKNNYHNGFTFEIEFTATNVYNENGKICQITNQAGTSGIVLTASEAIFNIDSENKVSTKFKSGKQYRIAFVKTTTGEEGTNEYTRFLKIYVNGILCGVEKFSLNTTFSHDSTIKIVGTKDATIELSSIQFYNTPLADDDILNNYMFYRLNSNEKTALYLKNNIYDSNEKIDIEKLKQQLPVMIFYQIEDKNHEPQGELHKDLELEFSDKGKTIYLDIEYQDLSEPDGKFDFYWKNAGVRPQGTSSMKYPKKNYRIYTQRDSENVNLGPTEIYVGEQYKVFKKTPNEAVSPTKKKRKYQFKNNAAPVKCFCLKADFAESSGTHNTGVAKYWNQVLVNSGFKTNAQKKGENYEYDVRTTIDGFPIALFYKPLGKDMQFLGKYNFNNDKSTEDVFGFTGGDEDDTKKLRYVPIGYNEPVIQLDKGKPVAEIINKDSELVVEDKDGNIIAQYKGIDIFNKPDIDDELEAPLYYSEDKGDGKTLYYKLETTDMFDNARMECWELLNSGTDLALFRRKMTGDPSKDLSSDKEKVGYIDIDGSFQESFESRFPDCGETYHTYNLERLIGWLTDCMYLKSIIVDEKIEATGELTGVKKGQYVPMTQEELEAFLGDSYKETITIGLKTKPSGQETFKYNTTNADGSNVYYKEISFEEIKNDVEKPDTTLGENGAIIEKPIEEYRSIELTDEQASSLGVVHYDSIPVDDKGNHTKKDNYISVNVADANGNIIKVYYCWGYTKVYYVTDYTALTKEVFGYNYVYDIYTQKYYTWGDFLYFNDYLEGTGKYAGEYPNTPANRKLKFAVEKYDHFRLDMMAAYYIYLMRFGGVDQTVKNAMLTTEGSDDNNNLDLPSKWYFINYDNDTVMGVKNDGRLVFDPYITRDSIENNQVDDKGNAAYCYAGRNSTMWNNFEMDIDFMELVPTVDDLLQKEANTLSYDNAIKMFNVEQSGKWCERVYNWDAKVKYIDTYTSREGEGTQTNEKGEDLASFEYLLNVQGPRTAHREWWLSKRFNIFDSKYTTGSFKRDVVTFKCNGPSNQNDICKITSGEDIYYGYYKNNPTSYYKTPTTIRPGETWELTVTANSTIGDPHAIFGSPNIEGIDFRPIAYRITELQMNGIKNPQLGTKLKTLLIGDNLHPKINTNFSVLGSISNMEKLEIMDLTGCAGLTLNDSDAGKLINLRELYLAGSATKAIRFNNGGDIEKLELPIGLNSLSLNETLNLTWDNLEFYDLVGDTNNLSKEKVTDFSKQTTLTSISIVGCPNLLNDYNQFLTWLERQKEFGNIKTCQLTLDKIDWTLPSIAELERLAILGEMQGDYLSLKGKIRIDEVLTLDQVTMLTNIFGNGCFIKDAELEIIALPGVYVAKYGNREEDYILEGDKWPNVFEIITIGFKEGIESITPNILEVNEKGMSSPVTDSYGINVTIENQLINISIEEVKRTIKELRIGVICTVQNEYGESETYRSDLFIVEVKKRDYPTMGKILYFNGTTHSDRTAITNKSVYTYDIILTDENENTTFNGNYYVEWTMSGEAYDLGLIDFVNIDEWEKKGTKCQIQANELNNKMFNLHARVLRSVEGEEIDVLTTKTVTKGLILKNENILLTYQENPALYLRLVEYGFIDNSKGYLEKSEAVKITLDTPCPSAPNKKFKDIFKSFTGYKENEEDLYDTILFTDFSIFKEFIQISSIPDGMFSGCANLKTIELPPYTTSIGANAFNSCKALQPFAMDEVTNIGNSAFYECISFVNVEISDKVTNIGTSAFYGCTGLQKIVLGKNITEISTQLFNGCTNLKTVEYGNITKIGSEAFKQCTALEKLFIPESLEEIVFTVELNPFAQAYKLIFEGGNDVYSVNNGTLYFNDTAKKWILKQNPNMDIIDNEEVYAAAYSLCGMAISDLIVPSNVIFDGYNILNGSTGNTVKLTRMFSNHINYDSVFSKTNYKEYKFHENETLIPNKCFISSTSSTIELPETIKEIGSYAFQLCNNVESFVIPKSVEKIGTEPFYEMLGKLKYIKFMGTTPPERIKNSSNNDRLLYKVGDIRIKVDGNAFEAYEKEWPDYKEMIVPDTLPSEGFFRIVRDGEIYDGNDVTIGGVIPIKQDNGYYKFTTQSTINDTTIKIGTTIIGNYGNKYSTFFVLSGAENLNSKLYSPESKGIDFTRGINKWKDVVDKYFKVVNFSNWEYDATLQALKCPSVGSYGRSIIEFINPNEMVSEDGYIYLTMGQMSEDSYDYFNIYEMEGEELPIIDTTKPKEIDIMDLRTVISSDYGIGKRAEGLYKVCSNYIKLRFQYVEGKRYYFTFRKDGSDNWYFDACWIYTIGTPIFIEPDLDSSHVEEFTIKVNPIKTSTNSTIIPNGVRIRITNGSYFEQYFLLDEEGKVTVKLPKNDTYIIEGEDYMIGEKPYYFKKDSSVTVETNGTAKREIVLDYEYLFGIYSVTVDGERFDGTNTNGKTVAYYIYATDDNDYYIDPSISTTSIWSKTKVNGEEELYISPEDVSTDDSLFYTQHSNGYENTRNLRYFFTNKNDISNVANKKKEYNTIIDWYIPSIAEIETVYESSELRSLLFPSSDYVVNLWSSNLANANEAWAFRKEQGENAVYNETPFGRTETNNIMFFGKIKL